MKHINYFGSKETKIINKVLDKRTRCLRVFCLILRKLRITADMISILGLLMLIGFLYYLKKDLILASIFIVLHILFDALDGPLARITGTDSNKGAFLDILVDHSGMAIVVIGLILANLANGALGAYYIYIYTIMIAFTIVRNILKIQAKLVIRTKYYLYAVFFFYAVTSINFINEAMIIFSCLMTLDAVNSFIKIRSKI